MSRLDICIEAFNNKADDLIEHAKWLEKETDTLRAKVEELTAACNALESSAIGSVERFRATGQITLGYKEFCALAELLPQQGADNA